MGWYFVAAYTAANAFGSSYMPLGNFVAAYTAANVPLWPPAAPPFFVAAYTAANAARCEDFPLLSAIITSTLRGKINLAVLVPAPEFPAARGIPQSRS